MPSVIEIGPSVLEKKVIKLLQCIFVISLFSPLGKGRDPLFEKKTLIPFIQGSFVPSLVEIGHVVLEKKDFLISSMYFSCFVVISP